MSLNDGGSISREAASMALQAANNEILGRCKKDKHGNYYARYSSNVRGLLIFGIVSMYLCLVALCILDFVFKSQDSEEILQLKIGFIVALVVSLGCLIILKKMMFYKYTLTQNEIIIKKVFSKERIPYSCFSSMISKYPPLQYRGNMVFMTTDKMIKFEYAGIVGGINFMQYLYGKIGYEMTDEEVLYLVRKVKAVYVRGATKEEKQKYKKYKAHFWGRE